MENEKIEIATHACGSDKKKKANMERTPRNDVKEAVDYKKKKGCGC